MTSLMRLAREDGSWQRFKDDWDKQCVEYGETLEGYAPGTFSVLDDLIHHPEANAGVYAFEANGHFSLVCQLNRASLPGYDSPVLRVRFVTVSPRYDLGEIEVDDYGRVLVSLLAGVLNVSYESAMEARYVNFHLRSPADRAFFAAVGQGLDKASVFDRVKLSGAWLYVTKK